MLFTCINQGAYTDALHGISDVDVEIVGSAPMRHCGSNLGDAMAPPAHLMPSISVPVANTGEAGLVVGDHITRCQRVSVTMRYVG